MFKNIEDKTQVMRIFREEQLIPPTVYITYRALAEMKEYVMQSNGEIGWLAYVEKKEEKDTNVYTITHTVLFEQTVSAVSTDLDENDLARYANKLMREGRADELNKIRCWGHSHVNMEIMPSGTDENTFEEYYESCDFFIRIIANKKGDLKLDIAEPLRGVVFTNVQWETIYPQKMLNILEKKNEKLKEVESIKAEINEYIKNYSSNFTTKIKEEIKDKVKTKYQGVTTYKNFYSYYDDADFYTDTKTYNNTYNSTYEDIEDDFYDLFDIVMYKNTEQESYFCVQEVFTEKEIVEIAINGFNYMRKKYKKDKRFANYTKIDWENLYESVNVYYEEQYCDFNKGVQL